MQKKNLILLSALVILFLGVLVYVGIIFKRPIASGPIKTGEQEEISYWTCSMHPTVKSDKPGKCPICGMELVPVYKETQEDKEYYGCGVKEEGHCPHCDKGIKDSECICGGHSFLIKDKNFKICPVCKKPLNRIEPQELQKEEESGISRVHLSQNQIQLAGIKTEALFYHKLSKKIRAVGKIAFDPELAVAQEEFLVARETREKLSQAKDPDVIARAQDILDKSKFRLKLLGMSEEEITQLENDGNAQLNLVLPEDKAWVYAEIYEYDLGWVKEAQMTQITTTAYPGEVFKGIIKSISPVLNPNTRTVKVRLEIDNPQKKLKPEMYVDVVIESVYKDNLGNEEVLAVPKEAVLDTGLRKIIYADVGNGTFIGKEIKTGPEATANINGQERTFYPVLSGLRGDEILVTKGNFLIDSQSQLTGGMSVLWGGASEIKTETPIEEKGKVETQHKH